ncbi:MAG: DNA polymerase III subunit beta [Armatimonadetes bacterium]|nr:DNA polymerase III subunit beta [Armatimonadota bacterium]
MLHEALQHVSRIVSGRTTLPILSNVLLEAAGDRLRLVAYDMEIGAQSAVPVEAGEEGALTVPARMLGDVVASLPDATVEIRSEDRNVLGLTCGRSEYTINGLPAEEYPALPEVTGEVSLEITQAGMRDLIRATIFAASTDETRAILTGVLLKQEKKTIQLIATDSYRLAVRTASQDTLLKHAGEGDWQVIIPARALQELNRMLDPADEETPVKVSTGEQQIRFEVGPYILISRLIEGQFPNYERVIPTEVERKIVVNREDLQGAIKRAAIVARTEASKLVFRTQEGQLTITAESGEIGRAHEELAAQVEGDDIEIAFNAEYLTEVLSVIRSDSVLWQLIGPLSSGLLKGSDDPDYLYVVMPMQL